MNYLPFLKRIGLSEHESRIYLDLIEHGWSTISDIARRVGCHRQVVYRTIPVLIESGLVSPSVVGKRRLYVAESPKHLQSVVDNLSSDFSAILPSLEESYGTHTQLKPILKFYDGRKGIRFVFDDVMNTLKKWEVFYRYSSRKTTQGASDYLSSNYRKLRDEKKIERMVITSEWVSKTKRPRLERESVTIPAGFDLFDDNISKVIYWGKVAIIDYNTDTAFIVESPVFATFERKLFQLLFRFLKKSGE